MIKKIASATIGAGLILATITPAFAASGCQNMTTGYLSNNLCTTILSKVKTLGLNNTGTVSHSVTKNTVSGDNVANSNTSSSGSWAVNSGNASADITSLGTLNTGNIAVTQSDPTIEHVGTNNVTGSTSNNTVGVTNAKTVGLTVNNTGTVSHGIVANTRSGGNSAVSNTITGGIQTGAADAVSTVMSTLNDLVLSVTQ